MTAYNDTLLKLGAEVASLAQILTDCGFEIRMWKDRRVYLSGYGRDVKAYLELAAGEGHLPADPCRLVVTSSWRVERMNGLRCKGVRHAILSDLFAAGLISTAPPLRWQDVELDVRQSQRKPITR